MIREEIRKVIESALKELGINDALFVVEHPTDLKMGDYSTNVAIKHGHKDELIRYIVQNKPEGVDKVELAGPGFINFYLSKEFFKSSLREITEKEKDFGKTELLAGKRFFIEHTQPNLFKSFHIGHLMNNAIGESLARIVKANGAEVRTATYHGDKGLHVAKAIWSLRKEGGKVRDDAYAKGHKAYEEDEEARKEIIEINQKIYEESDPEINTLYKKIKEYDIRDFEDIYEKLGSKFDYHFYESQAGEIGRQIVLEHLGAIFEESEGAIVYKGEKAGLHTRVFLNSQKLPTYEAKEVGLAKMKIEAYPFDQSITITGNEQDAFFNVVEAAIAEVFPELKGKLKHLSHGMLRLPTGKMSSRTGEVIVALGLINEIKKRVKDDEAVAIGAIKYMILRQSIGNDIVFDLERSVSTEGDSGVYLQYAHARASSVLSTIEQLNTSRTVPVRGDEEPRVIERLLYRFPEIVERAGAEYTPNYITTYLTELASAFNNFYANERIISTDFESLYRGEITKAFKIVMQNGLNVLGIPAPERM